MGLSPSLSLSMFFSLSLSLSFSLRPVPPRNMPSHGTVGIHEMKDLHTFPNVPEFYLSFYLDYS